MTGSHVNPIPDGFHTVTAALIVDDCPAAIKFYESAFGAKERARALGPGGKIWHAEVTIGDSIVMLADEFPEMGMKSAKTLDDSPVSLWLYVPDIDAVYQKAVAAGAKSMRPPEDQFWGDRMAIVEDPFGHTWSMASRKHLLTEAQMDERRREALARGPG